MNKAQFTQALQEAARITGVQLPEQTYMFTGLATCPVEGEVIQIPEHKGRLKSAQYVELLASFGFTFRLNELNDDIEVNGELLSDVTQSIINARLDDLGLHKHSEIEDACTAYAKFNGYNPITEYLNGLTWNALDHIGNLAAHFKESGEPVAYTFLKRWLIGAVAKAFDQKQNIMLVLEGPQGSGKSHFARWICPLSRYFIEKPINPDNNDDNIRLMSTFIWEVGELDSTTRKADVEALKAFITRETVQVRKSYGRKDTKKPAIASMIGTVNDDGAGFLVDSTGNRRFMVIALNSIDFAYTRIDVNQIWAQAVALYRAGEPHQLTPDEIAIQNQVNTRYEVVDPIEDIIKLNFEDDPDGFIPTSEIAAVVKEYGNFGNDTVLARSLSRTLSSMGYSRHQTPKQRGWKGIKRIGVMQQPTFHK